MQEIVGHQPIYSLNLETGPKSQEKFCLYISGALGTNHNIQEIRSALQNKFDPQRDKKNVMVVDSIMSPEGVMRQNRFQIMADKLVEEFTSGKELVVMTHSFGAPELYEVVKQIEKSHPELIASGSDFLKKLNIVMVAPFGFIENIGKVGSLMKRFVDVARTQMELPKIPPSELRGIESTTLIPVTGMSNEAIVAAIRKAFPKRSQYKEGDPAVELKEIKNYTSLTELPEKTVNMLSKIDKALCEAVQTSQWDIFRAKLYERGLYLKGQMALAYEGKYFQPHTPEQQEAIDNMGKGFGVAMLGVGRVVKLFLESVAGRPYKSIGKLKECGVRVTFLVPEYDVILKRKEAKKFLGITDDSASADVVEMGGFTHASFANQGDILVKGLEALGL